MSDRLLTERVKSLVRFATNSQITPEGFNRTIEEICSIVRQECEEKIQLMYNPDYLDFQKGVEAERIICQQKIEQARQEMVEEIEKVSRDCEYGFEDSSWWKELKRKWGVK